jgi:hypothetical protein
MLCQQKGTVMDDISEIQVKRLQATIEAESKRLAMIVEAEIKQMEMGILHKFEEQRMAFNVRLMYGGLLVTVVAAVAVIKYL